MTLAEFQHQLITAAQAVLASNGVKLLSMTIFANFLLAVAASLKDNTFTLYRVGDFVKTQLVPYALAYIAVKFVAIAGDIGFIAPAALGLIVAKFGASMLDSLDRLGIVLPDKVKAMVRKE